MDEAIRDVEDGEVIFTRDEPSDFACVIESGFIEIVTATDDAEDTIALLGPGELFGEMGVLDGKPRSATARARGPGRIREYEAREFMSKVQTDSRFAAAIMGTLVARLRRGTTGGGEDDGSAIKMPPSSESASQSAPRTPPKRDEQTTISPERAGPQRKSRNEPVDPAVFGDLPRVLIAPTVGDENSIHVEAIESWLGDSTAFAPIALPDPTVADPARPEAERAELARRALSEAKAGVVLLSRVPEDGPKDGPGDGSDDWLEFSVITEWPDDESRVGGFSAMDRFGIPLDADDSAIDFLRAAVTASVPGNTDRIRDALSALLPASLDDAMMANALGSGRLPKALAARQLIIYGNAAARLGDLEESSLRLYDAADAYRVAHDALPRDDRLGRGLARLHLAVTLNAASDRDRRDQDRERARKAAAEATELLHPVKHVYPYLTANARLGAILYRQALESGSLTRCKDGIDAFNRALAVCDKEGMPDPWADTMNGLGQLLILLARLSRNTEFLAWAVQVCRNAMEVRNQTTNPMGWARTLNNQATAQLLLGQALAEDARVSEAIKGFERAGAVFREHGIEPLALAADRNLARAKARQSEGAASSEDWWVA